MEIDTSYAVRTFFPNPSFIQVLFEAVANSLDAHADDVVIEIYPGEGITQDALEITVTDNGVGLDDNRYRRFREIAEPSDKFHKGLGRLVFLHYFTSVDIVSVFPRKRRSLTFRADFAGDCKLEEANDVPYGTRLNFIGFRKDRIRSYDDLKPAILKQKILDQFLPLLLSKKRDGEHFRIAIRSTARGGNTTRAIESDEQSITVDDVPDFGRQRITDLRVDAFASVDVYYVIRKEQGPSKYTSAVSVDGRTIPFKTVDERALPPNYSVLFLFESQLFAGRSDSARQRLTLPDGMDEGALRSRLLEEVGRILSVEIPEIEERNAKTRRLFEDKYPHLTGFFEKNTIGLVHRDEAIRGVTLSAQISSGGRVPGHVP